jgi:hypothetical protein
MCCEYFELFVNVFVLKRENKNYQTKPLEFRNVSLVRGCGIRVLILTGLVQI